MKILPVKNQYFGFKLNSDKYHDSRNIEREIEAIDAQQRKIAKEERQKRNAYRQAAMTDALTDLMLFGVCMRQVENCATMDSALKRDLYNKNQAGKVEHSPEELQKTYMEKYWPNR